MALPEDPEELEQCSDGTWEPPAQQHSTQLWRNSRGGFTPSRLVLHHWVFYTTAYAQHQTAVQLIPRHLTSTACNRASAGLHSAAGKHRPATALHQGPGPQQGPAGCAPSHTRTWPRAAPGRASKWARRAGKGSGSGPGPCRAARLACLLPGSAGSRGLRAAFGAVGVQTPASPARRFTRGERLPPSPLIALCSAPGGGW